MQFISESFAKTNRFEIQIFQFHLVVEHRHPQTINHEVGHHGQNTKINNHEDK